MTSTKRYYWIPKPEAGEVFKSAFFDVPSKPDAVRTVISHSIFDTQTGQKVRVVDAFDQSVEPVIEVADHGHTVFFEDYTHDWAFRGGQVKYFSRVSNGGHWVVCEWSDA